MMLFRRKLLWIAVFGIAFAFVESAVVVYLRALYYPEGFTLPLRIMSENHKVVELLREASTILMLGSVGILAGTEGWERFGYFMAAFGVWDIFYYVWLKVLLHWPVSWFDFDILFLLPVPWIGPVLAPVCISFIMIAAGAMIVRTVERTGEFRPPLIAFVLATAATIIVLYTFVSNTRAAINLEVPYQYNYYVFAVSLLLYALAFVKSFKTN